MTEEPRTNLPATTDEAAVSVPALPAGPGPAAPVSRGPRQNVTTGAFPIVLALLVLLFVGLAFFTLMAVGGGG